jgi:uncharacterized protein YbjT (DUF2867 family)
VSETVLVTGASGFIAKHVVRPEADATWLTELTGVTLRPARESVQAAGQSLIDHGLV